MKFKNVLTPSDLGLMLINRNDSIIGPTISQVGSWESKYIRALKQIIEQHYPGTDTVDIVDGGANYGVYSLAFSSLATRPTRVHAVEAQRLIFQMLNANMALNSLENVWTYHAVLGEDNERSVLIAPPDLNHRANFGAFEIEKNVRSSDYDGTRFMAEEAVKSLCIDDLNLNRCALIKLDVEGMEASALRGATGTIRRHRPVLFFERHKSDYEAIKDTLRPHGYTLWELDRSNVMATRSEWGITLTPSNKLQLA